MNVHHRGFNHMKYAPVLQNLWFHKVYTILIRISPGSLSRCLHSVCTLLYME